MRYNMEGSRTPDEWKRKKLYVHSNNSMIFDGTMEFWW